MATAYTGESDTEESGVRQRVDLRTALWGSASLFVVVATLVLPSPAEAGRGFAVYSYGEAITPIGEVAEEHRERVKRETGTNPSVGFIYSASTGALPWSFGWICVFNDVVWWPVFWRFALAHARQHRAPYNR